jgi:hypothetical protein
LNSFVVKAVKFSSSPEVSYTVNDLLRCIDQGFKFFEIEVILQPDKLLTLFSSDSRNKMELKSLLTLMKSKLFENSPFPVIFYFTSRSEGLPVNAIVELMANVFDHQLCLYDEISAKNYPLILLKNSVILANSINTETRSLKEFLATVNSNIGSIKNIPQLEKDEKLSDVKSRTSINGIESKKKSFKICDLVSNRLQESGAVNLVYLSVLGNPTQNPRTSTADKDVRFSKVQQSLQEETQGSTSSQFRLLASSISRKVNACPIEWQYQKDRLFGIVHSKIFESKWANQLGYSPFPKVQAKDTRSIGIVPLFMINTTLSNGYMKIKTYYLNESSNNPEEVKKQQVLVENGFARFFEVDSINSKPIIRSESEILLSFIPDSPSLLYFVFEASETGQLFYSLIDLRIIQKNFKFARIYSFGEKPKLTGLIFFNIAFK